jgi:hypothetical protein
VDARRVWRDRHGPFARLIGDDCQVAIVGSGLDDKGGGYPIGFKLQRRTRQRPPDGAGNQGARTCTLDYLRAPAR